VNIVTRTSDLVDLKSGTGRGLAIVTAEDCRAHIAECLRLRNTGKVSPRRVAALMAMTASWIALANQIERYETVLKDEHGCADR
jgi:hypothetical protein